MNLENFLMIVSIFTKFFRYLSSKTVNKSEENKKLVEEFPNEKKINLDGVKESKVVLPFF